MQGYSSFILDFPLISMTRKEFLEKQANLPANIVLVTDPDYKVTNLYGLRWNEPNKLRIRLHSFSIKRVWSFSRRLAAATVIACQLKIL